MRLLSSLIDNDSYNSTIFHDYHSLNLRPFVSRTYRIRYEVEGDSRKTGNETYQINYSLLFGDVFFSSVVSLVASKV